MVGNILLILGSYLFGALPFIIALGQAKGFDLSREEDLHIALWRKVGRLEGLAGILVDLSKGTIPVLLGYGFDMRLWAVVAAGVAAVAGQMWPVFHHFDGEKGNSVGIAMLITLAITYRIYPILIAFIPILLGVLIRTLPRFFARGQSLNERFKFGGPVSQSLPLGMATGFAVAPLTSWLFHQPLSLTIALLILFKIIILRRLTAGLTEDLRTATNLKAVLVNRFLYDRSYI